MQSDDHPPHNPITTRTNSSTRLLLLVRAAVQQHGFYIPAAAVKELLEEAGCSINQLLLAFLEPAAELARPPVSNYFVGAVGLAGSGSVYLGVNLEFKHTPLSQSVHAEQFLIANLMQHQEQQLGTLAISAAPCGHCRQFFSELCCADNMQFIFGHHHHEEPEVFKLQQLLPARFGPADLIDDPSTPLLLQPQQHRLSWHPTAAKLLSERQQEPGFSKAAAAAFEAAKNSYSPYTHCPSGVALVLHSGQVVAGSYVENAAHNPGLAPFQAAIVAAVRAGIPDYSKIQEVVIAEVYGAAVQHARVVTEVARTAAQDAALPIIVLGLVREEEGANSNCTN